MQRFNSFEGDSAAMVLVDVDRLNVLLRGELAAVETYTEALAHIGHIDTHVLQHIRSDHREAANWLRDRIRHSGVPAAESPGPWCAFASQVVDARGLIGMATILASLKQGEQHVLNEYEESLRNEDVDPECLEHLHTRLIPDGLRHLLELDHLLAQDTRV